LESYKIQSKFVNLGSFNDWVGPGNGLTAVGLEIAGAAVFLGISVEAMVYLSAFHLTSTIMRKVLARPNMKLFNIVVKILSNIFHLKS